MNLVLNIFFFFASLISTYQGSYRANVHLETTKNS